MTHAKPAPRGRDIHEQHRVSTPLELLFDLVFVVAIAQASSQLHHGIVEHHVQQAILGYLLAFAAIWWAWMNYSWFASAYDDDSTTFRLLTLLQMGGVLVLAAGIPGLFSGDFHASVAGYVIMRLALCAQWLLAARGDPARRRTCRRYAIGVAVAQLAWVLFLLAVNDGLISGTGIAAAILLLWLLELSVPVWAERAGITPWHAHHIAERYGLMVIIVLGECVLGTTNVVSGLWQAHEGSSDLVLLGLGGTLLIFALWWMYFLLPSAEALHHHRERAFGWGYGHYLLFAAVAAIGAGLEVVADVMASAHAAPAAHGEGAAHGVSAAYAITMVALAEAVYVLALWALHRQATRAHDRQILPVLICLACITLGPFAVTQGLALSWGLLLLSLGPVILIAYNERGRRRYVDCFSVR